MTWQIIVGDCVERMAVMPEASVDAVVCDPPYGLEFMGVAWDTLGKGGARTDAEFDVPGSREHPRTAQAQQRVRSKANRYMQDWHGAWAREALRVLKPGGHLLAFGGTRTYHRLAAGIEDAGFEIRDCVAWLYGSGFPKSRNIGNGWGTALKPAHEPVVVARKPLSGTVAGNVLAHGCGALNIDGCRIATSDSLGGGAELDVQSDKPDGWDRPWRNDPDAQAAHAARVRGNVERAERPGRWPSNVVLDQDAAEALDEQTGELGISAGGSRGASRGLFFGMGAVNEPQGFGDSGGASRFYYTAKASRAERNAGLDGFEEQERRAYDGQFREKMSDPRMDRPQERRGAKNAHPTVKPIALMRWLVRLVTPPGGTILDPFAGSGTTGCAAALEGFEFVGIERDEEYARIAEARIAWWSDRPAGIAGPAVAAGQLSIELGE